MFRNLFKELEHQPAYNPIKDKEEFKSRIQKPKRILKSQVLPQLTNFQ